LKTQIDCGERKVRVSALTFWAANIAAFRPCGMLSPSKAKPQNLSKNWDLPIFNQVQTIRAPSIRVFCEWLGDCKTSTGPP
jgi:hypothetical protein